MAGRKGRLTFHPHGSFCFAELHTPDVELGKRFYSHFLEWDAVGISSVGEYALFRIRRTESLHGWVAYVSVEGVDRTAERAHQLGATVVTAPFDTPGLAPTCVLADPEGAKFGLWETRGHHGTDVQDQTGSIWCPGHRPALRHSRSG